VLSTKEKGKDEGAAGEGKQAAAAESSAQKAQAIAPQESDDDSAKLNRLKETLKVNIDEKTEQIFDQRYKRRPQILRGSTYKFNTPLGVAYITINDLNGVPAEIFLNVGKAGSDVFAMSEALGRVCSLFLRYGEHGQKERLLIKHLKGIGGTGAVGFGVNRVESIADAVAKALEMHINELEDRSQRGTDAADTSAITPSAAPSSAPAAVDMNERLGEFLSETDFCPSCGSASLVHSEGCKTCTNCGYSKCS
jgi:ribonucleoside-diphosphate reductase alpha chain